MVLRQPSWNNAGSRTGATFRTVAADESQVTAGEHLARQRKGVRATRSQSSTRPQHANRPAQVRGQHGWFQEGGQRLGCRTGRAHSGAAAAESGGMTRLRGGDGSHIENRTGERSKN